MKRLTVLLATLLLTLTVRAQTPSVIRITPQTANIATVIRNAPAATTFNFAAGVYRNLTFAPRSGDSYIGENGTIFNGGRVLTGWVQDGANWYVGGQTQTDNPYTSTEFEICLPQFPRCNYRSLLFRNNTPLKHVASIAALAPGNWYFDYEADRIYVRDDPRTSAMEVALTPQAIIGFNVQNVTIRGLNITRYAPPLQQGALQIRGSANITIEDVTLFQNTSGLNLNADNAHVSDCTLNDNAVLAFGGGGTTTRQAVGMVFERCEIAGNNFAGANPFWEAVTKWVFTTDAIVQNNYVHDNLYGKGIWFDIRNAGQQILNNIVKGNASNGIYVEIGSPGASIKDNWVGYNGHIDDSVNGTYHAGIYVSNTSGVHIENNIVIVGERGNGIGAQQSDRGAQYRTDGLRVTDNRVVFTSTTSGTFGLEATWQPEEAFKAGNNLFDRNTIYIPSNSTYQRYYWNGRSDFRGFQSKGMETGGQQLIGQPTDLMTQPDWNGGNPTQPTATLTSTATATHTATRTLTPTPSATATSTATQTPTMTPTASYTPSATITPTYTRTSTPTIEGTSVPLLFEFSISGVIRLRPITVTPAG